MMYRSTLSISNGLLGAGKHSQSPYMLVYGEESTITKMHWLKLDPYRYQTES